MTQVRAEQVEHNLSEFLVFKLGGEEYALDILKVQEIRGHETTTQIANLPSYIKGVINLRGVIVPVVDMRIRLNLGKATYDQFTVVIILCVADRTVGMVVDGVSDVITLEPGHIKPAPDIGASVLTDYLMGLGTVDDRMLILVDIEKLVSSADLRLVTERLAA